MKPLSVLAPADDPRVLEAVQQYLAELEAGRKPLRADWLARFPGIADELTSYLDVLDVVHAGAPLLQEPPAPESPPAEPLGDFRIVREIGRGGMGVVYEAVQLSLGRRVALKVLPFAATLDARQLQRFKNEAQAAAQLHHTNIVPVYAVGCERGMHFYAMQLIEGRTLDAVIGELRGDAARDLPSTGATTENRAAAHRDTSRGRHSHLLGAGRSLRDRESFRRAAQLSAQAADALEYAHEAGVVHRDIKPANLLLDAKGNLWVTDFGLAQVSTDAGLTRTGDLLGTLRYMSPEQAAGRPLEVDHRCDVYSLGATLYELLTLQPAFPGDDRQTLLHEILNDEPRPPRQIDRSIPVELETIVLKAIAKSPGDRYGTSGEFAADLRRFLEERPILARRPSLVDKARKWVRRHPTIVGAALLMLAVCVVALVVVIYLVGRERNRTDAALVNERRRAVEVEQRFLLARRSADDMIRIANEERSDNPAQQALRRRLLEAALSYYQEFIDLRRDDPDAQADLELTRDRVQTILADLAALEGAWQHTLLRDNGVRDELKLAGDQRGKLDEMLKDMNPPSQSRRFIDEVKAHEAVIRATLTAEQLARLRQIALQVRGPMAFRQPDVIAALALTPEQREAIRAIEGDSMFVMRGGPGGFGGPGGRPKPPREMMMPRQITEKMLAVLTDEQKAKWRTLTGEPFRGAGPWFPDGPMPFGPGGPRR